MNTKPLKAYAPQARRDFIAAVTDRAALFGVTRKEVAPIIQEGDVALILGRPYPKEVAAQRDRLVARIRRDGFEAVMEAMAYTWFNRLMAIRYMELHGYLEHGYRVLSHPEGKATPEILEHAAEVTLPGLDAAQVVELQLAGSRDEELYRRLLLAQCRALHQAMPFLFESLNDETELLLPDRLLHTDSLVRRLVEDIEETAWESIEIVGWLYQFYISEKKDQVIGKVVKSEDIPAATQLFTPNWIVKYMVQNSLGAQWLATYPDSPLKGRMEYYIEPAEQTEAVQAQLAAITPKSLDPEALTLIDPACGSGHILVEAYELFKAIYLERGYRRADVARLILEKNLFGLDIDGRAAQLTGFALMMKGRADDRRLFERGVKLNVMALVDSAGFDTERLSEGVKLADYGLQLDDLTELKRLFEHATTFGSLIQLPEGLAAKLPALKRLSETTSQNMFVMDGITRLGLLVRQAEMLVVQYDVVVANPPYMGSGGMNAPLKKFAKDNFPEGKSDLFACFIERGFQLAESGGVNAMITMQSWMFLSGYQKMREILLRSKTIQTMAHLGARAFGSISGEVVQTTASVFKNWPLAGYRPAFFRLLSGGEEEKRSALENREQRFDTARQADFERIPGSPIAYWISESVATSFSDFPALEAVGETLQGMTTCDNDFYIRQWWEVEHGRIRVGSSSREDAKASGRKWFPYTKGGAYRKWAGNSDLVVNWEDDGALLRSRRHPREDKVWAHNFNLDHIFREGGSYSSLSSGTLALRYTPAGSLFDQKGSMVFANATDLRGLLALMNSRLAMCWLEALCPTLDFNPGALLKIPVDPKVSSDARVLGNVDIAVTTATADWNACDTGMDFQSLPLLTASADPTPTLESSYTAWIAKNRETIAEMKRLEEENNRLFIDAYGLQDELTPDVPIEQITLTVNPAYRYGGKLTEEARWTRFREDSMKELISYAIGCMMGRYSLDEPGLIYAHSGDEGFDPGRYATFPADDDGVIPVTDRPWFDDDATHRLEHFLAVAWDEAHLKDNLAFLADNLSPKQEESSRDTLRRYLANQFFKDHLQSYKKRPIYWLFSSGKQRAFQCLVYLHRYHAGTLGRMRTEYILPLQGKIAAGIQRLEDDIEQATATPHRKKLEKERETLLKQRIELQDFDQKIRHYADQRIALDLDDGVKVNYGKFGDLLAEVKAVTGKAPG
jgi:type II restriction/modification system DNA methylase subunit YeeA